MRSYNAKPSVDNVYFQGSRKGEVNQLRVMLKNNLDGKNQEHRRQIIKKIIAYTTLGVDTSRLFPQMIIASSTEDVIQKKLINFYLTIYAEQYSDVAIMAINTFFKDCQHPNPRIRCIALKSLCSLKFKGAYEYIMPVIRQALQDHSPYVKKSAVLGLSKVYYIYPELKNDIQLLDKLYALIRDDDKTVVINAILTLNEILAESGGIILTQKLVFYLLNNLQQFNEWGQITILELLQKYDPQDKNIFNIMNLLETRLKHSSPALVLAAIKIFIKYADIKVNLFTQIIQRIKYPLITLMATCWNEGFEISYIILQHIYYIISKLKGKELFHKLYKNFFCKADEPSYIKVVKIDILKYLATDYNYADIFNQLQEYINQDEIISRKSINALGEIALNVTIENARLIIKILLKKIQLRRQDISNESAKVFQNLLRKYPNEFDLISVSFDTLIQFVTEDSSKSCLIQILGDFGQKIEYAPQYVTQFTYDKKEFENLNPELKEAILKSSVSLFLKRPSDMQQNLARVFANIINSDESQVFLKDRASFYYRAMQSNFDQFRQLFLQKRHFTSINQQQVVKFKFNTLEILYKKDESQFIKDVKSFGRMFAIEFKPEMIQQPKQQKQIIIDVQPKFKILQAEDFQLDYTIQAKQFQNYWTNLQQGACITRIIQNSEVINEDNLQQLFKMWRIYTMASGQENEIIKMYFYAKIINKQVGCMQLQVNKTVETLTLMTKCQNQQLAGFISKYIEQFLKINEII